MVVREILFYEELSFQHYLQHYSGTTRTTHSRYNCARRFIGKSSVTKYHQLLKSFELKS